MGNWAVKIAKSFMAYIFLKAIKGMADATTEFGAAYQASAVTPAAWNLLHERVSAANGGMNVIAIGTPTALGNCTLSGNFQVAIGEKMNEVGYLDQYLNVPLIAVKNVMVPGTANGAATLALPTDKIYMIPVGGDRPVKILFEGNEISVMVDPEHTSDVRYGITVELRVGISAVCGAKYGTISL